jgi:hypothetical protein
MNPEDRAEKLKENGEVRDLHMHCPAPAVCYIICCWAVFTIIFGVMFLIFFFVLRGAEAESDDCEIHPFLWL